MDDSFREPDQLPPPWKVMKYVGIGVAIVGLLMFLSVFISMAFTIGNFDEFAGNFDGFATRTGSMAIRAVFGMLLMMGGGVLAGVASYQGRTAGNQQGPSNDGTWGSSTDEQLAGPIRIRCPRCRALNDEAAKCCDQCGTAL